MTRIVGAFAPWVMGALSLYRLQATVLDFNAASARVLLANGFVEEGTQRLAVFKRGRLHDLRTFARIRDTLHDRSEEHTSELQSLMRISYAVFCLKKKNTTQHSST